MDHAANNALHPVKLYNANSQAGELISLILQAKGRDTTLIHEPCNYYPDESGPVIEDAGIVIKGLDRVIDFLEHKYPAPALTSSDPVHRVTTRMLLDNLLENFYKGGELKDELTPPPAGSFILGRTLSIIDLAILPITSEKCKKWAPLRAIAATEVKRCA
jgi:hypothetical protein